MARWYNDPGLRRLVKERKAGDLSRREFLARLGGAAAGAATVSFAGAGPVCTPEQKQAQQQPNPIVRAQSRHSVPDFKANFDLAARTSRPAPLAPGSAEVP